MRTVGLVLMCFVASVAHAWAIGRPSYVSTTPTRDSFVLVRGTETAAIVVDSADWPGLVRAASDLRADLWRVTGQLPVLGDGAAPRGPIVIVGTIGKSKLIDRLVREGRIDIGGIAGKWESFFLETVTNPLPGVPSALVIAGSDKRGTIFGIYDLSEQIGVSPWYWWADVTPDHKDALYVAPGKYQQGEPSVKYRGIFFNDERPDLDYWVRAKIGERPTPGGLPGTVANFNREFYTRVFEVLLRMKANYLWPAMWNNAFAEDDPENPRLADEYGIVMGTSHQEPMLRAQKEWDWHLRPTLGLWNYAAHPDALEQFWRGAVRERKAFENIYTIGLRGENDTAMVQGPAASMALLDTIVVAQRKMLAEEVHPDVTRIPQLWCLYKEVQGYYESGLRVPDDVTLLWAEDNWGNVRRLPTAEERTRAGGAGIYYHFDYHGGPRSYQWVNTSPIAKIWEQMSLAKDYGADRIWIVNVGHFKGYEFPTEYFLSLAWNTTRWTHDNIGEYTRLWAAREFGAAQAQAIASVMSDYTRFNGRRKPELLDASTYSLVNHHEAETVVAEYNAVVARAQAIFDALPPAKRDAFYQLALFPAKASAQVNELYVAAAKNALFAAQGRASTNDWAERTRALFQADADLMTYFNKVFAGGKWDHFMDQSHIGYTGWADPPKNTMDAIRLTTRDVPREAGLGVSVEGQAAAWPGAGGAPTLPVFDALNRQRFTIDLFNRGATPFAYTATASAPWIVLSAAGGTIEKDARIDVSVDWSRAPAGTAQGGIRVAGANAEVTVGVVARTPADVSRATLQGFAEGAGYVSIEPEHFTNKTDAGPYRWIRVEDYGRTLSGMRAAAPVDALPATPGQQSASLEYRMYLTTPGPATARLTLAPTLNFVPGRGLRVAVSFDDEPPQAVTIVPAGYSAQNGNRDWEQSVRDNARVVSTTHAVAAPGYHTLKIWMVDPAVVVQRILVSTGGGQAPASYLGPPESYRGAVAR